MFEDLLNTVYENLDFSDIQTAKENFQLSMMDASHSLVLAQDYTTETEDVMMGVFYELYSNTDSDFRIWHGGEPKQSEGTENALFLTGDGLPNILVGFSCECSTITILKAQYTTAHLAA